jgi:hypothetical protein
MQFATNWIVVDASASHVVTLNLQLPLDETLGRVGV